MSDVKQKVKLALDESRLLVLGAQILLGFQFRAFLEPGFERLGHAAHLSRIASPMLMLWAIFMLMWPICFHEIATNGNLTQRLANFANCCLDIGLFPFGAAIGLDVFTASSTIYGSRAGLLIGLGTALIAFLFWYGIEWTIRLISGEKTMASSLGEKVNAPTSLHDKIDTVLTECRIVIPGSQALLGFQLIAALMDAFARLPASSKLMHLAGLLLMTLSTICLMAPAAFHRIVERGEDSQRMWHFSRAMLLSGMALLASGLCCELFVVMRIATHSTAWSITIAAFAFAAFTGLWFGYTVLVQATKTARS